MAAERSKRILAILSGYFYGRGAAEANFSDFLKGGLTDFSGGSAGSLCWGYILPPQRPLKKKNTGHKNELKWLFKVPPGA